MNRLQNYNQGLLHNAPRTPRVIRSFRVTGSRTLEVEQASREEYWAGCEIQRNDLEEMKTAWEDLLKSGYSKSRYAAYVHAFFCLLKNAVASATGDDASQRLLAKVIGFESFEILGDGDARAAGVFSNRNPAYMLSRLALPNSFDDPKYLPLVKPLSATGDYAGLYSHYRRIAIANSHEAQLFVYPPDEPNLQASAML